MPCLPDHLAGTTRQGSPLIRQKCWLLRVIRAFGTSWIWVLGLLLGLTMSARAVGMAATGVTAPTAVGSAAASRTEPIRPSSAMSSVRIGVLAFYGKQETLHQWQPTAQVLEQAIGHASVQVIPLDYNELNAAVASRSVDFVLTNPEHFVVLRKAYGLTALATLTANVANQIVDRFGSVIFRRSDHFDIRTIDDVRDQRVAAVGPYSLGGFLLAADTLRSVGIDLRSSDVASLKYTGLPHPKVVEMVLSGEADVGIVRTGVLEAMVQDGRLDPRQLVVLNRRPGSIFPQQLSTELSPEWPWATMPQTDPALNKIVTLTLMSMSIRDPAAIAGQYAGFSPPANYAPIEDMMRRLRVFPRLGGAALLEGLWYEYDFEIGIGSLLLAGGGVLLSLFMVRANRRQRRLTQLYFQAKASLQTTAAAFDSQIGLIITDQVTRIVRVNHAFTDILGYTEPELLGKTTAFLRGDSMHSGLLGATWQKLQRDGHWSGELNCMHREGREVPCMVTITAIREVEAGLQGFVGSFVDMSQHHRDQAAIRQLAFYDVLTSLPNRRMLLELLERSLRTCQREGRHAALLCIDLDHFKHLNDTRGHALGDALLQQIAQRLRDEVGELGVVARLGGDEFVVLLHPVDGTEHELSQRALQIAEQLGQALQRPCQLPLISTSEQNAGTLQHRCSASIGLHVYGPEETEVTEIMKRADIAMYQAKHAGRSTVRLYDPMIQQHLIERAALAADLASARFGTELIPYYQVQVDTRGRPVAAECLLRWHHPQQGLIQPTRFIPLAEETGLIVTIGHWVIEHACETLARWAGEPDLAHLELGVNVSPRQFVDTDFVPRLQTTLQRTGARPAQLMLEITEGIFLEQADEISERMQELRTLGVHLSIDDFGTGYSSLSYLQRLPLSQLKIDRSFVHDLNVNRNSEAIVRAIITLGSSMALTVVAEGVEYTQQRDTLVRLGCSLLQGYHLGAPTILEEFEKMVRNHAPEMRIPTRIS